jgi:hypothetical protein
MSGAPTTMTGSRSSAHLDDLPDRDPDGVEQRVLEEQVLDRVTAQPQLGEHCDRDVVLGGRPRLLDGPLRICRRICNGDGQGDGGDRAKPWA